MDVQLSTCTGNTAELLVKTTGALVKLQISHGFARHQSGPHDQLFSLRSARAASFPEAVTLADRARLSAAQHGLPSRAEPVEDEALPYKRGIDARGRGTGLLIRGEGRDLGEACQRR